MTRTFRYVPLSQVPEYEAQGWVIVSLLGPPHGFYAVLMEMQEATQNQPE